MTEKYCFCGALGFISEVIKTTKGEHHFGDMCCRKGEIKIPKKPQIPKQLQDLFKSEDNESKYFLKTLGNLIVVCQWHLFNLVICHCQTLV